MINELLGKEVTLVTTYLGAIDSLTGQIVEIQGPWLKMMHKDKPVYINISQIVRIAPL